MVQIKLELVHIILAASAAVVLPTAALPLPAHTPSSEELEMLRNVAHILSGHMIPPSSETAPETVNPAK